MDTLTTDTPAPLPPAQQRTLEDLVAYIAEHGYAPTHRELATRAGLSSTNALRGHLEALRRKGYIVWDDDVTRSLRVVDRQQAA